MEALMKDYVLTTDKPKLSGFISLQKKTIVQYLFNLNIVEWEDIRAEISKCCGDVKSVYKELTNDKNIVDWVDLSNTIKRYKAFMMIEKKQNDALLNQAREHRQLEDPFQEEEAKYISPLLLKQTIKDWKSNATRIEKLHLQDLLFYNILDFVSAAQNGSQQVLGKYFEAEKERIKESRNPDAAIKSTVRTLLGLKNKSKHLSLNDTLIQAKNVAQDGNSKSIRKICKLYVNLEKEKIRLYTCDVNEATYLMCLIRPIYVELAKPIPSIRFVWCESALACKKAEENALLIEKDERAANTTKIDGIIINEDFNLEIGLIEISGPNNKVNSTHFYEDRKKLAKNLKSIYKAIMRSKDSVAVVNKRDFKVYGFHIYLNKLHIYSLSQSAMGHYVFGSVTPFTIPSSKVVTHALPSFLANLWIVRDILNDLNKSLVSLLTENEPSSQSSSESDHDHYVSPTKRQKTASSRVATN